MSSRAHFGLRPVVTASILLVAAMSFLRAALPLSFAFDNLELLRIVHELMARDDYRRYASILQIVPLWLYPLQLVAGILFLNAAWRYYTARTHVFAVYLAALALERLADSILMHLPAYGEALATDWSGSAVDYLAAASEVLLPFGVLAAIALSQRRA